MIARTARATAVEHCATGVRELAMGEVATASAPGGLTIHGLGSCIAVCLDSRALGKGGLAHAVVPRRRASASGGGAWSVPDAVDRLHDALRSEGARDLVAHLAGGAGMFAAERPAFQVGSLNAAAAAERLRDLKLPVSTVDIGGQSARRISYDPASGRFSSSSSAQAPDPEWRRHHAEGVLVAALTPLAHALGLGRRGSLLEVRTVTVTPEAAAAFAGGAQTSLDTALANHAEAPRMRSYPIFLAIPTTHATHLRSLLPVAPEDVAEAWREIRSDAVIHAGTAVATLTRRYLVPGVARVRTQAAHALFGQLPPQGTLVLLFGRADLGARLGRIDICVGLPAHLWTPMHETGAVR